jgi:FkbM family methyltransferase
VLFENIKYKVRKGTLDEMIINEVWNKKMYNKYLEDLDSNPIIIDIGAHIGGFSLMAASKYPDSMIYCYEPHPENYSLLKENIMMNNFENTISCYQKAVTGKSGKINLKIYSGNNTGLHKTTHNSTELGFVVDGVTLQEIFKSNNITKCDFLKIDCEGAEEDIILNTPPEILKQILYISMELHFNDSFSGLIKRGMSKYLFKNRMFNFLKRNKFTVEYNFATIFNFKNIS